MDETEEIKRRIDIVDFISTYLTLKKAGSNYKALCPFHQEKTPSFMVSPEKQIFKCFGCSQGGDIFTFVMEMENLDFPEALRLLAERAGVKLRRQSFKPEEGRDRKTKLYKINHLAALAFHKILLEHSSGQSTLEYLKKRGITLKTIKDFMLGYAPAFVRPGRTTTDKPLLLFLKNKGFTDQEVQEAGSPDRFFRRIMFPIQDAMGNIIAFTGRATVALQEPKYLNTPDTSIFHKGRVLYNLNRARGAIKQAKATIVVEGQMDVIASHQAGIKNVVASSGTALTEEHLQILYRYTPNIIFAFDSDSAGMATAKKAFQMAIKEGFNVKMVNLAGPASPAGGFKDPGEMIAKNPRLWQEAILKAIPVIDWYFKMAFRGKGEEESELTSQEKKEIAKEILPIIKIIPDSIEQAHYVNLLAKRLSISEEIIFNVLAKIDLKPTSIKTKSPQKSLTVEELLLGILLSYPEKIKKVKKEIEPGDFNQKQNQEIYKEILKEYNKGSQNVLGCLKKKASRKSNIYIDNLIFQVEKLYNQEKNLLEDDFIQAINHLKKERKEAIKSYYALEIQKAERSKDRLKLKKLIKEFQEAISK